MSQEPAILITKFEKMLSVFSSEHAGAVAWVLDFDNDMAPSRLCAVVQDIHPEMPRNTQVHSLPVQKPRLGAAATQRIRAAFHAQEVAADMNSAAGRNIVLAALRLLQLHVEQNEIPAGIQESFFESYDLPSVAALDRLCEALNT